MKQWNKCGPSALHCSESAGLRPFTECNSEIRAGLRPFTAVKVRACGPSLSESGQWSPSLYELWPSVAHTSFRLTSPFTTRFRLGFHMTVKIMFWSCYWHPISSLKNAQSITKLFQSLSRFFWRFCCVFPSISHFTFSPSAMRQALGCEQIDWADCVFFSISFPEIFFGSGPHKIISILPQHSAGLRPVELYHFRCVDQFAWAKGIFLRFSKIGTHQKQIVLPFFSHSPSPLRSPVHTSQCRARPLAPLVSKSGTDALKIRNGPRVWKSKIDALKLLRRILTWKLLK